MAQFEVLPGQNEVKAMARASSIAALCGPLHQEGLGKVSPSYFEFLVDFGVWVCFFKKENPSPSWPWMVPPQRDDPAQGASPVYTAWLKDQAKQEASKKPEAPNDPATTVAEASTASTFALLPAAEIDTKATTEAPARILPPPQGSSSSRWTDEMEVDNSPALLSTATLSPPVTRHDGGQRVAPKEPSRSKRLDIWRTLNRSDHWVAPVSGPFEVLLPQWLDFDTLIWGPEGTHFAYMHEELIDQDLIITWGNEDGFPSKLIVGFRDDDDSKPSLCKMDRLGLLFARVTNWAADVYDGSTQSLLSHLSLSRNMANESMYQPLKPGGRLCLAWQESRKRQ